MSLLKRFFSFGAKKSELPDISFGRYTDAYKTEAQKAALDLSLLHFEAGRTMEAYDAFFTYLCDTRIDNVRWRKQGEDLFFEFRQGSRRVFGSINAERVRAESPVAKVIASNVGFLRRLIEQNYGLRYCRYALSPENFLTLVFDSHILDASPLKLQSAFRELAIHADKQDDLLLDEFESLAPADERRAEEQVSEAEKATKYDYFRRVTEEALALLEAGKPDPNQYPGGYAFLLLGLAFRLDYLIRPEGFMMNALEKMYAIYFASDGRGQAAKVTALQRELQTLLQRAPDGIKAELYRTRSTFGISPAVKHERISSLIDAELPRMDWHIQQQHPTELALAVPKYIVGHCLFYFAPPPPIRELLHLFFQITEASFFAELGFAPDLTDLQTGLPQKSAVERAIQAIRTQYKPEHPKFKPDSNQLIYTSLPLFAQSYLQMIRNLEG
jgi:hypothetical protein